MIMPKRLIRKFLGPLFIILAIAFNFIVAEPAQATGVYQMPPLSDATWIVDDAGVLSRLNEGKITTRLKELAEQTGNEVRMVIIHRLDYGETPASFASSLMEKWFPASESQSHKTLLVLDDVTNGAALEVGEEVAPLLTEDIAASITQETIGIPLRQANKYNQALLDASDRLIAVLSGQADPGPPVVEVASYEIESTFASAEETEENRNSATFIVVGFLIAATVIPMATYYIYQSMGG